jgi:hypothetical protein
MSYSDEAMAKMRGAVDVIGREIVWAALAPLPVLSNGAPQRVEP